jgi:protein-S-isoprenylcysteine O-methyltransferase Ste14
MSRPSLKKIFGVGPLGGVISVGLLLVAAWIDHHSGLGAISQHSAMMRWIGGLLILCGLGMHAWSFMTLRQWWVESRLCTRGPFRFVRHPMYAGWINLIVPGVVLILNRWSYVLWLVALHPLWHALVRREERVMERHFGEVYRRYAAHTGRFLPRPGARHPFGT